MNVILMEIFDEYDKSKTINSLEEFTYKTFPKDGTDKIFIGCVLILINSVFRTRVNAETLKTIVLSAKEYVGDNNLLKFYMERVNGEKIISKYLYDFDKIDDYESKVDMILDYLDHMSFDFVKYVKKHYESKLND